jgi:hypothetical protein
MPTHLYCLLPTGSSASPPASVRALAVRGIVAWVSDTESPRLSRDARDAARAVLAHDRVVAAAVEQGVTPVPASLADPYESDQSAIDDISSAADAVSGMLRDVAGKVEMTAIVSVIDAAPAEAAASRGREYLEQIRSRPGRAQAVAGRVAEALVVVGGEPRVRPAADRVALSHLIPRDQVVKYREAAQAAGGDGYRIVVDGPRAPYSFATFRPRGGTILAT